VHCKYADEGAPVVDAVELLEDRTPGQATFDRVATPTDLTDREQLRQREATGAHRELVGERGGCNERLGGAVLVEDPQDPFFIECVHPCFAAMTDEVVGLHAECFEYRHEVWVGREVHRS
jgi:hypothetical protein